MMLDFSHAFHVLAQLNSELGLSHSWTVKKQWGILYQDPVQQWYVRGGTVKRDIHVLKSVKRLNSFL